MTEAVIFDMDGVIINSEEEHYAANLKLFSELGISLEAIDYNKFVGLSSRLMWKELKNKYKLQKSIESLMLLGENAIMAQFEPLHLVIMPGLSDLLDYINERSMKIAIASSSPLALIELVVKKLDIAEYFDLFMSGDDVPRGKPYPDIYSRTAALLKTSPENCLVIEDSYNGAQAAKKANMKCIGFNNPSSGNQDLSSCILVVNSFLEQDYQRILDHLW
jgi:HAD superfamily hydrolase (TIGR01509 family)